MRFLNFAFVSLSFITATASASPNNPKAGVEYTVLSNPQKSQSTANKVEVIEFFMYHCPFCHAFEPELERWVKNQGSNIIFKRIHMPYQGVDDPETHLFLTLEALGKSDQYQVKVLDAIGDIVRRKRSETLTEQEVLDVAYNLPGNDKTKFKAAWDSFGVKAMQRRAPGIVSNDYRIDSTPTIVVDGKYITSPGQVGATTHAQSTQQVFHETLQVMDALIKKVGKSK